MNGPAHHRVFAFTVLWTLGLLWLGSVVHATESSLACPDWPTCYGSWTPEMTGGVFWEHGHRLVAGALILIFGLGTVLAWRAEPPGSPVRRWTVLGVAALLLQAVLGGLTVIFRLPTAVSTSHLALAFLFLALAVALTVATGPSRDRSAEPDPVRAGRIRRGALHLAGLVFVQSVVGAGVRHADAGMACPDVPLCLGRIVPPMANGFIALHFGHRVLGYLILVAAVVFYVRVRRSTGVGRLRILASAVLAGVLTQVLLGFASVYTSLAVAPVSLHTLVAASVLALLVGTAALTWPRGGAGTAGTDLGVAAGSAGGR